MDGGAAMLGGSGKSKSGLFVCWPCWGEAAVARFGLAKSRIDLLPACFTFAMAKAYNNCCPAAMARGVAQGMNGKKRPRVQREFSNHMCYTKCV